MKELLSPVGNMKALYATVQNGADAVYLGGKFFTARKFSDNFTYEELKEAVYYTHLYGVKIYITVNTIVYEEEVKSFLEYIDYLYVIGVDALIMQDIGMISLVRERYPDLEIHASTQLHTHNNENIKLLNSLGVKRVVLDREMPLQEVKKLDKLLEKEIFIHGALCNSYSGCCLMSSLNGKRSGNRGECVQSCRLPYRLIKNNTYVNNDNIYLLSTKELCTINHFDEILSSDIQSFKIEGRMKSIAYTGYVTSIYRSLIDGNSVANEEIIDNLKILFNRDFTSGYLFNDKVMNTFSSNHQGLEIGKVIDITENKIKIKLSKKLYQEDGIRFKDNNSGMIVNKLYNEEGLLVNKAFKNEIVYVDNKVNLKNKSIVVKTSSTYLEKKILENNNRKVLVDINVTEKDNKLIIEYIDDIDNIACDEVLIELPLKRSTTKEEIKEKLSKLGNTCFKVNNINIDVSNSIFISMSILNNVRRNLIDKLIYLRTNINRQKVVGNIVLDLKEEKIKDYEIAVLARCKSQVEAALSKNVNRIYVDTDLYEEYKDKSNVYLRLPRVVHDYNFNSKNLLVEEYGAINKYNDDKYNVISDYYLNVVNNYTIKYLLDHNVKRVTISPEYDYSKLSLLVKDKLEIIIYGTLEAMLTKSCPIKEVNMCPCKKEDIYFLEDINKNKYRILHDKCLTHIMNYEKINYLDNIDYYKSIGIKSYRLELLDESYDETVKLIDKIKY